MGATVVIGGLELGLKAMQIWADYNTALLALQQQRQAEGKEVTQAEVDVELAKTHDKLAANHDKLLAAKAAQVASDS